MEHPAFPRPDPSAKLWRYMNWDPKFTSLVREERLWMSWLSMFDDKFEGKTPRVICWAMSDTEDNLLWGAYTKTPESVAVQTTFERLERPLPQSLVGNDINIGMVTYNDYRTQGFKRLNMFERPMHKRRGLYASEREVRALAFACPFSSEEIGTHLLEG